MLPTPVRRDYVRNKARHEFKAARDKTDAEEVGFLVQFAELQVGGRASASARAAASASAQRAVQLHCTAGPVRPLVGCLRAPQPPAAALLRC